MQGMIAGNWVVEKLLGEGGMGKVYLARHRHFDSLAALKVLSASLTEDQSFRSRFLQEARTQYKLQHPNIAKVIDYLEEDGKYCLLVEYLPGGTLADVIDGSAGPVETGLALSWTAQALSALDYAHQKGVIHRDIKPSNIMFDDADVVKVMDFGIALVIGGRRLTNTGTTVGTPGYMSPEQIIRPKEVDHRTDVYSMGIVLYEMLTGQVPFQRETDFATGFAQVNDPPPPLRDLNPAVSQDLERAVMRALAKDPNHRYSGCGEFADDLERLSESRRLDSRASEAVRPPSLISESAEATDRAVDQGVPASEVSSPQSPPSPKIHSAQGSKAFVPGESDTTALLPDTPKRGLTDFLVGFLLVAGILAAAFTGTAGWLAGILAAALLVAAILIAVKRGGTT
jgi:eukaryotic-like serine/threonine-protein kinase